MRCLAALPLLLALAACGEDAAAPEPAPEAKPKPAVAAATGPRTLIAADFAALKLGPRIEGPQGDEVSSDLVDENGDTVGKLVSYVACPAEVTAETCDPATLGAEAFYTYVHTLTLDAEFVPDENSGLGVFQTSRRATGFNNTIGFDAQSMTAALGEAGDIRVQTDSGKLIWRITAGDGLGGGESLTLFWQSTLPPEGPSEAFRWDRAGVEMNLSGPFPPRVAPMPEPEESATD